MHGVHTFLGWDTREAASAEAGKLLPGTWEASPAGRVGAYRIRPPSATIGGEYMFHIRPLRVRLRGRMRYAPTAGYRPYGYQANFAGARRRPRPYSQASADAPEAERETRAQRDARIRRLLANYPAFSRVLLSALHAPHRPRHRPRDGRRTHGAPFHNAAFRGRLRPPAKFA